MPVAEIETEKALENSIKPSLQVRSKQATASAVASSLPGATSNVSEARFWAEKFGLGNHGSGKEFAHPRKAKLKASSAAIIHALTFGPPAFSSTSPLAVVSGPRVRLYGTSPESQLHRVLRDNSNGNKEQENIDADRQVQTGGSLALAAAFRHDGRLLAVATDNGQVRVADATTRATFCTFQSPTKLGIRSVSWFRDGQKILAAGDDAVARVWSVSGDSVSSGKPLFELTGHGDGIRCAGLWQASQKARASWPNPYLAFTGSYDHTVRIWRVDETDSGNERCLAILSHDAPVEALMTMPSANPDVPVWVLSAGGTYVKVWNPLTGVCVCKILSHHRKTITAMVAIPKRNEHLDLVQMRVVTGGLDGLIRIHSWNSSTGVLEHVHGVSMPTPITALAFSEPQTRLAIGTVDGNVLIRQKGPSIESKKRTREPKAGTYAFFTRGMNATPSPGDFVLEEVGKKRKLTKYDLALKQFRYSEALDEALATRNPITIGAVVEELGRRRGLTAALSNRDEETLEPLLSFTTRYMAKQRYTRLLMGIANRLVDIYGSLAGQSEVVDELFRKLKLQVGEEVRVQKRLHCVAGELDALITSLAMNQDGDDGEE